MTLYRTITADPPWLERGSGKVKRGADRHYPLMTTVAIGDLMAETLAGNVEANAHLYLWVTNNFLEDGLSVMRLLGFRYVTNVAWVKSRIGLGRYFRGRHELALFGVKGRGFDVRTASNSIPSTIQADHRRKGGKRVHSGKPEAFYEMVEARSHGPYLEMFARQPRAGWDVWGNEVSRAA